MNKIMIKNEGNEKEAEKSEMKEVKEGREGMNHSHSTALASVEVFWRDLNVLIICSSHNFVPNNDLFLHSKM